MFIKLAPVILLALLGTLIFSTINLAYPTGAPNQHTGAAGEHDCSTCHFGELGNTEPQLTMEGLDDVVRAGGHYVISLHLTHAEMQVAGIQATIRAVGDTPELAGELTSGQLNGFVKDGITYLNHSQPLQPESGSVTVTLEWDVPEVAETALFNVAMVAGNNDSSPFGDSVIKLEKIVEIRAE